MEAPVRQRITSRSKSIVSDSAVVIDDLDSYAACFCCNPFEDLLPELVSLQGQAFDVIAVQSTNTPGRVASSAFMITFDHPVSPFPPHHHPSIISSNASVSFENIASANSSACCEALLEVEHEAQGKIYFPIIHDPNANKNRLEHPPLCEECGNNHNNDTNGPVRIPRASQIITDASNEHDRDEMNDHALGLLAKYLKSGRNPVRYLFRTEKRVLGVAHANIYLWGNLDKVIVCDVDGTITKSNVKGIVSSIVTEKYDHCHDQVCKFMSSLVHNSSSLSRSANGNAQSCEQREQPAAAAAAASPAKQPRVHMMYLSSRPIFLATATRKFLYGLRQSAPCVASDNAAEVGDTPILTTSACHRLPEGPLIGYGGKFMDVMKMELVTYTVHLFKASQLMDQVVTPFCAVSDDPRAVHQNLFVAGFGNTMMDVQAYHMAGMDPSQIYMIDKKSCIRCFNNDQQATTASTSSATPAIKLFKSGGSGNSSGSWGSQFKLKDSDKNDNNKPSEKVAEADQPKPFLRAPFTKKMYKNCMGASFRGYQDVELVTHVLTKKV